MHQSCQWSAHSSERGVALSGARLSRGRALPQFLPETIGRPSGWGRQRMEFTKCVGVGNDQIQAKATEHGDTIVATAKFTGCDVQKSAHMSAEALWRAVVEVVGDVRDGETGVFKEPSSPNEPCHCEIAFGRGRPGPKEAAHQRTWSDIQKLG